MKIIHACLVYIFHHFSAYFYPHCIIMIIKGVLSIVLVSYIHVVCLQ